MADRNAEKFFAALSRSGPDTTQVQKMLREYKDADMKAVVNYTDVGGMTPLHRAARIGNPDLVNMLMNQKADANAATFPSRAPGSFTPLQCLAEADMSSMDKEDMRETTRLLLNGMTTTALGQRTTKGANVFHLVVSRGNLECLEEIVEMVFPLHSLSTIGKWLNATSQKGKTVLDLARYNKQIAKVIRDYGGVNAYEGEEEEEERNYVPEWHHWNRRYHRAQWRSWENQNKWTR